MRGKKCREYISYWPSGSLAGLTFVTIAVLVGVTVTIKCSVTNRAELSLLLP